MEKLIIKQKQEPIKVSVSSEQLTKKVTVIMDQHLLTKLRNIIAGEKVSGYYQYYSVSALIRASLVAYQDHPQVSQVRQLGNPRVAYTVVLPSNLYELYQS
jgi:hypothetical protein